MAAGAKATEANAARRLQMLRAAAEVMSERGFADTRIADVAARSGASSALIIYYFGSRDRLLVDALRFSEAALFDQVQKMLAEVASVRERFSLLIRWTCLPHDTDLIPDIWGLWLDLWAQAFRREEVARGRAELDDRWRALIVEVIQAGRRDGAIGDVEPRRFAVTFAALLDGLSIQVALNDPEVDPQTAYEIAMGYAERELSLATSGFAHTKAGDAPPFSASPPGASPIGAAPTDAFPLAEARSAGAPAASKPRGHRRPSATATASG